MSQAKNIFRCASCDGFGWFDSGGSGPPEDCDWCGGVGYVYNLAGRDEIIPNEDYGALADQLEALELERLRELGYQGIAKRPWQQAIRKDTQLGRNPYNEATDDQASEASG